MTLKQLKSDLENIGYTASKDKNVVLIFKNGSYIGSVNWTKSKLTFNGKSYTDVKKMMADIEKYNETLEFQPNTYCPIYTKESVTSMRIHKTLDDCGFNCDAGMHSAYGSEFTVHSNGIMGAHFGTIVDNYMIINDGHFIQMYEKDDDDTTKCNAIKSMANVLYVANLSVLAEKISNTKDLAKEIKSIPITVVDPDTLDVKVYEGIDGVINVLETTLKKLKRK